MTTSTHKHTFTTLIFSLLTLTTLASTTTFIESKCSTTTYPAQCVQSLSSYATKIQKSPRQLAQTALTISLAKARYAKAYVSTLSHAKGLRPREARALKDCVDQISDTVDRLGKSVREFHVAARGGARKKEFKWHVSNVMTWASAALTNENTCVDGFEGREFDGRIKTGVKAQFKGVMQSTSNALALVNQFAATKYSP